MVTPMRKYALGMLQKTDLDTFYKHVKDVSTENISAVLAENIAQYTHNIRETQQECLDNMYRIGLESGITREIISALKIDKERIQEKQEEYSDVFGYQFKELPCTIQLLINTMAETNITKPTNRKIRRIKSRPISLTRKQTHTLINNITIRPNNFNKRRRNINRRTNNISR